MINKSMVKWKLRRNAVNKIFIVRNGMVLIGLMMVALLCVGMVRNNQTLTNEDFIRLHVIANSNSREDQNLKLKVRDELIEKIDEELAREAVLRSDGKSGTAVLTQSEMRTYLTGHLDEIAGEAEKIVSAEGYSYNVNAEYGECWIPRKTYGSVTFPAGNYEALKVEIGKAEGQNWWCVLFPPLCLIDENNENKGENKGGNDNRISESENKILYDSFIQSKYGNLMQAAEDPQKSSVLKLKFKTIEIIRKHSSAESQS